MEKLKLWEERIKEVEEKVKGLFKSTILENQGKKIKVKDGEAILSFSPYSVNTYKIIF